MDLITVTRDENLECTISVRGHAVKSDLSAQDGGADHGPSPAELLGASLGACITMMVQAYCQRHGWEGDAGVSLTMELADDPKRVGRFVIDLEMPNGVPENRHDAVRRVAERCVIHETLRNPPVVDLDIA